jgi:hypothetical protein
MITFKVVAARMVPAWGSDPRPKVWWTDGRVYLGAAMMKPGKGDPRGEFKDGVADGELIAFMDETGRYYRPDQVTSLQIFPNYGALVPDWAEGE